MNKFIMAVVITMACALMFLYSPFANAGVWTLTTGMLEGKEIPVAIYEVHEVTAICSSKKETPYLKECFEIDPSTAQRVGPKAVLFQTKAMVMDSRNIQAEKKDDYNEKHYM